MVKLTDGGISKIITDLISEVDEIEASDQPQGEKTRRFKAAAKKVKNALFLDKRKYRGNGLKKRLSANSYNTYMTRIRKQFDDRLHHHFNKSIEQLANKYPIYRSELVEWLNLPAAEIRQRHRDLQGKLREIMPLGETLTGINFGPAAMKKMVRLAKKYPKWNVYLMLLAGEDWRSVEKEIHQAFQQGERLLEDLDRLKINHEILYHLQLDKTDRASIQQRWDEVLSDKKRSTVLLDYPSYMQAITEQIYQSFEPKLIGQRKEMAPLAFALAAVSGRRLIEVMVQGEFEVVGKYELMFYGQAKKRTGGDPGRKIYVLCDPKIFVQRVNELRSCPAASDFDEIRSMLHDGSYRAANVRIASILGNTFNQHAKLFFQDERRTFKDTRAIYARITYEAFFRHDPRWKNVDEDVFFSEILGHDDENTQLHYKQFKLHNFTRSWRPNTGVENKRLAALQDLDEHMPSFARGDAGVRIHETTKRLVDESADIVINTKVLRDAGFNPTLVRRYLDFVTDALGQAVGENGWMQADVTRPSIILNSGDDDNDENIGSSDPDNSVKSDDSSIEPKPEDHISTDKPRFAAPISKGDNRWLIKFEFSGAHYSWEGDAENVRDAMKRAWDANI
ncbi:protelomerase [Pectobacterium aroidearum]|uniref:Protelomerase n=1 Tax=Pectobacterium aroidearum TaxID=1201031 RepID=A0ABR5ZJM5_9GAMM|nr:protelomerase family protein [Pectobacterium aroidearum]MBA5234792.1 protelomerase [Pectobacterium aroidearum]MBA5739908.1 protelomerase [Pectobacterium aroidearum]